jgi:hypothetical protein
MGVAGGYPLFLCLKICQKTIIESSLGHVQPAQRKSQSFCAFGVILNPTMTLTAQSLKESYIGEQSTYPTFGVVQVF